MELPKQIFSEAKVSPRGKVNEEDIKRWLLGLRAFLIPLALVYVLQVYASVQKGVIGVSDLYPTQATIGAIQLYVLNAVLGILRKFNDGK